MLAFITKFLFDYYFTSRAGLGYDSVRFNGSLGFAPLRIETGHRGRAERQRVTFVELKRHSFGGLRDVPRNRLERGGGDDPNQVRDVRTAAGATK